MGSSHLWMWVGMGLVGLVLLTQVIRYPAQTFWRVAKSAVLGCLFVFAVNWIGQYFHYHLPFNPMTALTAGFLGIPGVVAMIALQLWLY